MNKVLTASVEDDRGAVEELLETEDFREHLHREFRVPIDSGIDGGGDLNPANRDSGRSLQRP